MGLRGNFVQGAVLLHVCMLVGMTQWRGKTNDAGQLLD